MKFRQILRALGKSPQGRAKLREILANYRYKFSEQDVLLIQYAYLERLSVANILEKLSVSKSHYHNMINRTIAKFETVIDVNTMLDFLQTI